MKKTFLKATLFSLLLVGTPTAFLTGCTDYHDDIDRLGQQDASMEEEFNDKLAQQEAALTTQLNALQTALAEQKAEAARATEAAAKAAAAAQATADQAEKSAQEANAKAEAAAAAAAAAQVEAIEEATKKVEALRQEINGQISDLRNEFGDKYDALAAALAKAATKDDLDAAVKSLSDDLDALKAELQAKDEEIVKVLTTQLGLINKNTAEITKLAGEISGIKNELQTLSTSLSTLSGKVDQNTTAIGNNTAAIGQNKKDIAEAVKDIQANTNQINNILNTLIPGINKRINDLDDKVNGIGSRVGTLETRVGHVEDDIEAKYAEFVAFKTATNTQLTALINFKQQTETTLANIKTDITGLKARITAAEGRLTEAENKIAALESELDKAKGEINTLKGKVAAAEQNILDMQGNITDLQNAVTGINGRLETIDETIEQLKAKDTELAAGIKAVEDRATKLETGLTEVKADLQAAQAEITKIDGNLSTLNLINSRRLTSVTLVPGSYVGGIPTIEFYSASYKPMGNLDTNTGFYAAPAADAEEVIVTNNDTKVYYRLNPAGVTLDDIVKDKVTFVQMTAASRAAETPKVKVVNVEKDEEGMLVVTATKADGVTTSIDNAGEGKIYTVALKVPVAPKNYYTWKDKDGKEVKESAEDAVVYSEYSRLAESTFVPGIAYNSKEATADNKHFWSSEEMWAANADIAPVLEVSYMATNDSTIPTIVAGCMNEGSECTLMDADQLASFGFSLEYSIPKKPYPSDADNHQAYAKITKDGVLTAVTPTTPTGLTAASRVDKTPVISVALKHGNKVVAQRFFKIKYTIDAKATAFTIKAFEEELSCEPIKAEVTMKTLTDSVISKLPFAMSANEFVANYSLKAAVDGVTVNLTSTTPIIWDVALSDITNMDGNDKTFEKTLVFVSDIFPDVTVKLNGTVKWPAILPTLGKALGEYWKDGVLEILPLAKGTEGAGTTATYNTNILLGRPAPYLTNLLGCAVWDVQLNGASDGFTIGAKAPVLEGDKAYKVMNGTEEAASLWYMTDATAEAHAPFTLGKAEAGIGEKPDERPAETLEKMNFFIEENESGKKLVEDEATIDLGWYIFLNGVDYKNSYARNSTKLKIKKPLKSLNAGAIEPLTQAAEVQIRNLEDGMTFTDCFNNTFVEEETEGSFSEYYGIEKVVWDNELQVRLEDGSLYEPEALGLKGSVDEETGILTFTGSGAVLLKPMTLIVPVTVEHKWGTLKSTVEVTINPFDFEK